jgi:hypothetical protein
MKSSNLWSVGIDPSNLELEGEPTRLTHASGHNPRDIFVTADGTRLGFLLEHFQQDVYVSELDLDGTSFSSTRQLTFDNSDERPRGWLPDSRTVLFDSNRAGSYNPYRQHLEELVPANLHSGPRDSRYARASPEGDWILFFYGDDLMRVPTVGGPPERVMAMREQAYRRGARFGCVFGGHCVVGERAEASQEYVFFSLDSLEGKGDEIARIEDRPPFVQWALSPNGRTIAVVNNDGGLRLLDLDSGTVEEIKHERWTFREFVAWDAFGNGVYTDGRPQTFYGGRAFGKQLVYTQLGEETKVHLLGRSKAQWFVLPEASPDGRYLAYGIVTFSANAWMLENF